MQFSQILFLSKHQFIFLIVFNCKVIGNNNLIMGSCHIAHDCKIGSNNIFSNNTLLAGHVIVEVSHFLSLSSIFHVIHWKLQINISQILRQQDYARTAGAIVVHQFCHLGSHCFIGGGSVVCDLEL